MIRLTRVSEQVSEMALGFLESLELGTDASGWAGVGPRW